MPRGRPKKLYDDSEVVTYTYKYKCDLCNCGIDCSPCNVRLNDLTGCANWHRNTSVNKLCLCNKCAKELNEVIDNFIINKNKRLNKFDFGD